MANNLKAYDGYKKVDLSWLDIIPMHWKVVKNNSLWAERKIVNYLDEDLLSVTIKKGIIRQSDLLKNTAKKDSSNLDKSKYKLVMPEDIAYNKMRMWQGAVGKSKYKGIVSPAYVVLRPIADINTDYYHYLLRTPHYIEESHKYSYGICDDQLNLRYEDFKRMQIVVPPKDEQEQIVRYLDSSLAKINRFIKAKKKLIGVLKEQKQAIINEAVTKGLHPNVKMKPSGIDWLGDIPEGWKKYKLKSLSEAIGDGLHGTPIYTKGGGYYFVNGNNLGKYLIVLTPKTNTVSEDEYQKYKVHLDDNTILISLNGTIGSTSFYNNEPLILSKSAGYIRLKSQVNKMFIYRVLQSQFITRYFELSFAGTTINNLSLNTLRNTPIFLPSADEQQEIINYLEIRTLSIDKAIEATEDEIKLITEYRIRLISDVVTGKVDVRGKAIDDVLETLEEELEEELLDEESLSDEDGDENAN